MRNFGVRLFALVFGLAFSSLVMAIGTGSAKMRFCAPTQATADCVMEKQASDLYDTIKWDCKVIKDTIVKNQYAEFQAIDDEEPFEQSWPVRTAFFWESNYCANNTGHFRNDGKKVLQINTGLKCKFSGTDPNKPSN